MSGEVRQGMLPVNAVSHIGRTDIGFTSKSLLHPGRDGPQISIDLGRRSSKNQGDDTLPRTTYVLESTQDVNLAVREHDPGPSGRFDSEFCFSLVAGDSSDRPI
jgi:hypothetical protein